MRSFYNLELMQRIERSPENYIVQRKVSQFESYMMGYDMQLQLENEKLLEKKYASMPSLDEYIRHKYHAHNIGTRNCFSIISFVSEDEHDFFQNYFDIHRGYENENPVIESVRYVPREYRIFTPEPNYQKSYIPRFALQVYMAAMRKRFRMYFRSYSLADFRAWLDGYFHCKEEYNLPMDAFDIKVREFTRNIICEDLELTGRFVTWDRKYRYDRDWNAWGEIDEAPAKKMLDEFWIDMERYTQEKIE